MICFADQGDDLLNLYWNCLFNKFMLFFTMKSVCRVAGWVFCSVSVSWFVTGCMQVVSLLLCSIACLTSYLSLICKCMLTFFHYRDSQWSGLFSGLPTSPNNQRWTVFIFFLLRLQIYQTSVISPMGSNQHPIPPLISPAVINAKHKLQNNLFFNAYFFFIYKGIYMCIIYNFTYCCQFKLKSCFTSYIKKYHEITNIDINIYFEYIHIY